MNLNKYAAKRKQLKFLAKKLVTLITEQQTDTSIQVKRLIARIKLLIQDLKHVLFQRELKRILGAAVVFLGISFTHEASAQKFATPVKNPFGLTSTYGIAYPAFADLDDDGDLDLLVGEYYGVMQYFKNTGSKFSPQFAAPQRNPFGLDSGNYYARPTFADLDGDGDLDLLIGEYYGGMQYFKNTGTKTNPQFAAKIKNPFGLTSTDYFAIPVFVDMDGDGDFDIMVGEEYGNIKYFKNTGTKTNPQFAAPIKNPFGFTATNDYAMPAFADLDKDGDMDMLVGEDKGAMQYFKNTGTKFIAQFAPPVVNPFGLDSTSDYAYPAFADLDGDGDMDLLVGEYEGSMQYFQNIPVTGIVAIKKDPANSLYPNPFTDVLYFNTKNAVEKVEISNSSGQIISVYEKPKNNISLKELPAGTYLIKISDALGNVTVEKIMKQ